MASARIRHLEELAALRDELAAARERADQEDPPQLGPGPLPDEAAGSGDFRDAMGELGVRPLQPTARVHHAPRRHPPHAASRARDDAAVLVESVSDEIDVEHLLDTDEALSYRRPGIGPDVLRRLRRGEWVIQNEIDLHGLRVDDARAALGGFLREAVKRGVRCVRVVHGKGLRSKDRTPILKSKVRGWLAQRDAVIAFCQARGSEGGAGALIVLLRPAGTPKA